MRRADQIAVPSVVRVKPGALDRTGLYLSRQQYGSVAVLQSTGLVSPLPERVRSCLEESRVSIAAWMEVDQLAVESAMALLAELPPGLDAIVGLGGGRALDIAKYIATQARLPYFAVPTSLSQDGFCSPQASLSLQGKRCAFPADIPFGLVIDTQVCQQAPKQLSLSGVGDLVAKFTAVRDWKLAFHACGEPVDDFAALLSDGSVHAFISHPRFDERGMQLLATSLMMNGIAMAMCGSSRPASGSEHLISHALDQILESPRLHGLQVGVASYFISLLQKANTELIDQVLQKTGFWDYVFQNPFPRDAWLEAVDLATTLKPAFYTVLSSRAIKPEVLALLKADSRLAQAIV